MRILVALSGGVDSSVVAALLADEGHELVGVTLKNWCYGADDGDGRSCCSLSSIEAARSVARALGMPHYVLDFEEPFAREVIRPFVRDYLEGRTPNPCVSCNARVRFPGLLARARAFGCDAVATGHYARVDRTLDPPVLRRPADRARDQSYVLWSLEPDVLRHVVLPLGQRSKAEVRELARERGLAPAERPDSQEVCFVRGGDVGAFLAGHPDAQGAATLQPGEALDPQGRNLGTHAGVARYTIGQRRGLGLALGRRKFVVALDARGNRVVLGEEEDLEGRHAELRAVRWPHRCADLDTLEALVQLRSRHAAAPARVFRTGEGTARVEFAEPQRALTPGQSAVFYDGDAVIGGGIVRDRPDAPREG